MVKTLAAVAVFLCAAANAAAQGSQGSTSGPGKIEIGGFPMGGTFFVGGDGDQEANFNVYSTGANLTYYLTPRTAIEGELGIGIGWAQDITYKNAEVLSVQMPNVWDYFANVVWFPNGGAGQRLAFYVTAGAGAVSLQSRQPTKPFGYDTETVGFETFLAENIGGGVKIFRGPSAPQWGFRVDYRYLIVNANSDAPAFFAKSESRAGHRISFGILFTAKR
jgi:hypothetical protein